MHSKETNEELAIRVLREIAIGELSPDPELRLQAAKQLLYVEEERRARKESDVNTTTQGA